MQNKLLDFLYNWDLFIIWWYSIPRKEIEFYLENNLDLSFTLKIRDFLYYCDYTYEYDIDSFYDKYNNIKKFIDKNNINYNYYWFMWYEDLVSKIMDAKNNYKKKTKEKKSWYIYIIKSWDYYKIWRTINIKKRINKYITENPNDVEVIHYYKSNDYISSELNLHLKFKDKNHNREWFILNDEDILYIKTIKDED